MISHARAVTACGEDPELFASTDLMDHKEASRHCAVCPLLEWCEDQADLAAADAHADIRFGPKGTWAGRLLGVKQPAGVT